MTRQTSLRLGGVTLAVIVAAAALLLFASTALAAGTLAGETKTVAAGGAATVNISGDAGSGAVIGNWTVVIAVDTAKLGTPTCGAAHPAGECSDSTNSGVASDRVQLQGASGSGLSGAQVLGAVNVTAQSGLAAGACADLTITITKFQNDAGADLGPAVTNGKVCVQAPVTSAPATTAAPTASGFPNLGGSPDSPGSVSPMFWVLAAAGLVIVSGAAWAVSRARREI
jgi:hypothetical protein